MHFLRFDMTYRTFKFLTLARALYTTTLVCTYRPSFLAEIYHVKMAPSKFLVSFRRSPISHGYAPRAKRASITVEFKVPGNHWSCCDSPGRDRRPLGDNLSKFFHRSLFNLRSHDTNDSYQMRRAMGDTVIPGRSTVGLDIKLKGCLAESN